MKGMGRMGCGWIAGFLLASGTAVQAGTVQGWVVDDRSGKPLEGVAIHLLHSADRRAERGVLSDSSGWFRVEEVAPGLWQLQAEALGYEPWVRSLEVDLEPVEVAIRLRLQPLLMDEMIVRARRPDGEERTPAFVELIPVQGAQLAISLPEVLDQAVGVKIRRSGGLGSFSTVSIRGSTAEQVQVYLDGVPLNQALGGGVNLGDLAISGVERVEVYRGAIPATLGGNSIGGVIHIRTQSPGNSPQGRLQGMVGSFGTRQWGASASGIWQSRTKYLALVDYLESRNDFRFWDDNGTEYNSEDDEWAIRANSDFRTFRTLAKLEQQRGATRLQVHDTFDLRQQGIPGIGNYQALRVRSDAWRNIAEGEVAGILPHWGGLAYRLGGHYLLQQDEYRDPKGEVGTGIQHYRNALQTLGLRAELDLLLAGRFLVTAAGRAYRETFSPRDLLHPESRLYPSRRHSASLALDGEMPLWRDHLELTAGNQVEVDDDRIFAESTLRFSSLRARKHLEVRWGRRVGARWALGRSWAIKGHLSWYQRPPNFFELFGDRGTVIGNADLVSEKGRSRDLGVNFKTLRPESRGVQLLEVVLYRTQVQDLIRFIQNSQRVSRPHNIGEARISGLESRAQVRLLSRLRLSASYVYQKALDHSPFSYHRGKDLPNAPRQVVDGDIDLEGKRGGVRYELSCESRHFLDRANLRPVSRRLVHSAGARTRLGRGAELELKVCNLTANQVADLWGYPLPGRSYFISFKQDFGSTSPQGEKNR